MSEENKTPETFKETEFDAREQKRLDNRRKNLNRMLKEIQHNANNPTMPNAISKEITEQQAFSIFLRSRQLVKEGQLHFDAEMGMRRREIDECYNQRKYQINQGE